MSFFFFEFGVFGVGGEREEVDGDGDEGCVLVLFSLIQTHPTHRDDDGVVRASLYPKLVLLRD